MHVVESMADAADVEPDRGFPGVEGDIVLLHRSHFRVRRPRSRAGEDRGRRCQRSTALPERSSSSVTAMSALAERRTLSPSTPATKPSSI